MSSLFFKSAQLILHYLFETTSIHTSLSGHWDSESIILLLSVHLLSIFHVQIQKRRINYANA